MRIGLPTALFIHNTVQDAVLKLSNLGADCIEIVLEVPHFPPEAREVKAQRELKDLLSTVDVDLSAHSPFYDLNLGSSYREIREFAAVWIKKCIHLCSFLGIGVMTVHPGYFPAYQIPHLFRDARAQFVEYLRECVRYGKERGVKVSIENIQAPHFFCYRLDEMAELVGEVEGLGLTLDIGHAYIMKITDESEAPEEEIAEAVSSRLRDHLTHIHLHDNRGVKDSHLAPGEGKINFKPIVDAIKAVGYSGQVIVEAWAPERSEEAGARALAAARKLFQTG